METIMIISLLIVIILTIVAFSLFNSKKHKESIVNKPKRNSNRGSSLVYNSNKEIFPHWNVHNNPIKGDNSYAYKLETKDHKLTETATELSFYFKAKVQKNGNAVSANIKTGTISIKGVDGNVRNILNFFPTHNAPKDGFYLSPVGWNEVTGSIPTEYLKEGDNIYWEATSVTVNNKK